MLAWRQVRDLHALVFDIENRPLSYWYDGATTAEVTVIAYKWLNGTKTKVLLADGKTDTAAILAAFRPVYEKADVLIGHNIRKHDLPILNGAYVENEQGQLPARLTIDTLRDLARWKDIPKSLEYLTSWLGCSIEKPHMDQHKWREANRLSRQGVALARKRCAVDVRINEWCYRELVKRGLLVKPPSVWKP
jgi:hypothetical protein